MRKSETKGFIKKDWDEFEEHCCFTDDELEVLPYLKRGFYAFAIARELSISESTAVRRTRAVVNKIAKYLLKRG